MKPFRTLIGTYLIFCIIAAMIQTNNALTCLDCFKVKCSQPEGCMHGLVKNTCGCCDVCAKGLGQECGGIFGQLGKCGQNLECEINYTSSMRPGICVAQNQTTPTPPPRP